MLEDMIYEYMLRNKQPVHQEFAYDIVNSTNLEVLRDSNAYRMRKGTTACIPRQQIW
jgi:hypothetical protein